MRAYYNEFNPTAASMLRQMIDDGLIMDGDVDERSITEVHPDDIKGYTRCHFFAGIGGWEFALQYAGWPANEPVWTGSAPCQPFSTAGKRKGKKDERHLFPVWMRLIAECRPATIFGEQVATAVTHGWLDDVYQGLEAEGYAVGAAVLPACSVGAPHKRDRLWFVGHAQHDGQLTAAQQRGDGEAVQHNTQRENSTGKPKGAGAPSNVANPQQSGLEGYPWDGENFSEQGRQQTQPERPAWASGVWVTCPDGKQRLVEPSIPLLADGVQHRKPILHALGNAIVPQVAAEFIKATM